MFETTIWTCRKEIPAQCMMCLPTSKPPKLPKCRQIYIPYIECLGIDVRYTPPKINYWNLFTWFEDSK